MGRPVAFVRRANEYLESVRNVHAKRTLDTYGDEVKAIARDAEHQGLPSDIRRWGEREILALTSVWIRECAPKTVAKRVTVLNNVLAFHGNLIVEAMKRRKRLRLPKPVRGPVRWVSESDMRTLIVSASGTTRLMLVLAYYLGLRRGEIAQLRLADITDGMDQLVVRGKGMKLRVLPLMGPVGTELSRYLRDVRPELITQARRNGYAGPDPEYLLLYVWGPRVSGFHPKTITERLRYHGERLGIPFSPHDARRGFAQMCSDAGLQDTQIQKLMGHEDLSTTASYLNITARGLERALDQVYASTCTEMGLARE